VWATIWDADSHDPEFGANRAGEPTSEFLIITDAAWPLGVRCGDCHRELPPGAPYAHTLEHGDAAVDVVVCVYCALGIGGQS
jgi:hypothetical protein